MITHWPQTKEDRPWLMAGPEGGGGARLRYSLYRDRVPFVSCVKYSHFYTESQQRVSRPMRDAGLEAIVWMILNGWMEIVGPVHYGRDGYRSTNLRRRVYRWRRHRLMIPSAEADRPIHQHQLFVNN